MNYPGNGYNQTDMGACMGPINKTVFKKSLRKIMKWLVVGMEARANRFKRNKQQTRFKKNTRQ
jgi:hypothetical protein